MRAIFRFIPLLMFSVLACIPCAAEPATADDDVAPDFLPRSLDSWEKNKAPQPEIQPVSWPSCIQPEYPDEKTVKAAVRGMNLANSGHFEEAIEQLSIAINGLDGASHSNRFAHSDEDVRWRMTRAKLYLKTGQLDKATEDVRQVASPQVFMDEPTECEFAILLFKLNQYEVADKLTSRILETARTNKSNNIPALEYLRAYCEEHLGKADDAVADYFNAANHFMQSAVTNAPALLCLKRAGHISSQKMKTNIVYDLSVLKPPREGVEEIKAIVEKLMVEPDCFNVSVLEKIIGTNRIDVNGIRGRFISTPFPYLPLVRLHCITRDQLYLGIDPKHCCLFMSDLKKIFANCERVDYANHETNFSAVAYKVAGGTLTLTERREGFPAIMAIRIETPHTASSRLQPLTPADYRQSVSRSHGYPIKPFVPESGSSFNSTRNP